MTYAPKKLSTVSVMSKNLISLSDEIKALEKARPPQKPKIKALQADLDKKGAALKSKYDEAMDQTRKDFLKHAALVDDKLGEASATLRLAKKTASELDPKAPDPKLLMALTKPSLADKVLALAKDAKADSDEFGASWLELRGYNPGDSEALKPFVKSLYEKRSTLMGDAKSVLTKIDKIKDYADEISVITNNVRAAFTKGGKAAASDAEESIDELSDEVLAWCKDAKGGDTIRQGIARLKSVSAAMAATAAPGQKEVNQFRGAIQEGIETAKTCNGRLDVFAKKTVQAKKMFGGASRVGDTKLAQVESGIKAYKDHAKALADAAMAAGTSLQKLQSRIKQGA